MTQTADNEWFSDLEVIGLKLANAKQAADQRAAEQPDVDFNLFTTLLKEDDEVRLHTRFIHCLLNPQGKHGGGPTFLNHFFAVLSEHHPLNHADMPVQLDRPNQPSDWSVRKEVWFPDYGQLDLLLESPLMAFAIENKLNAGEQPQQLKYYADFVAARLPKGSWLLYLTKDGKKGITHDGRPYLRISYQTHVVEWLARCLADVKLSLSVRHALAQYQNLVKSLVGKTQENETMKDICAYITAHPNLIGHRQQIKQALDQARAEWLNRMAQSIADGLKPEFNVLFRPDVAGFGYHGEGTLILTHRDSPALATIHGKICVQHWVQGSVWLIGIETNPPLAGEASELLNRVNQKLNPLPPVERKSGHSATATWPVGWHNLETGFDDARIAELMANDPPDFTKNICEKIRTYLSHLERALEEAATTQP